MRLADGPTTEVEVLVDAPLATVWALVTDVALPARFSAELQEARWLDATGPALGAHFVGRNRHPAVGEWETTSTVTVYEPMRAFGWAVQDPANPAATWRFTLEPAGGQVRLRQWVRLGPGPSGLTPAIAARPDREERILESRLEEHRGNMRATLEGLKGLAEAEDPATPTP